MTTLTRLLPCLLLLAACNETALDEDAESHDDSASIEDDDSDSDSMNAGDSTTDPGDSSGDDCDDADSTTDDDSLSKDELANLDSWVSGTVALQTERGETVVGDTVSILLPAEVDARFELVTTTTRAQDYNSSRSNRTGSVDLGGDDDQDSPQARWDGLDVCVALPCPSAPRPDGAASRLVVESDGGAFYTQWAETTPMSEDFSGVIEVGTAVRFRGHVTVLKAAATPDGDVVVTSALPSDWFSLSDGDEVLYEDKPSTDAVLATIPGVSGASWPKALSVEETALGTVLSLHW